MKMLRLGAVAAFIAIAIFLWIRFEADPTVGNASEPANGETQRKSAAGAKNSGNSKSDNGGGARPGGRGPRPASLVVTRPVTDALINDRLKAVGNGTAVASVSVVPLSGGLLTEVTVSSGQRVDAGAVLATLESEEQLIARDRAALTVSDATTDAERLAKLYRSRTATEVELNRTNAALADARLALRESELTLSRRTITAPIAGIVGLVSVDSGNYVTSQTELVTIDDRSIIVVEYWIPERFANQIAVGQSIKATALAIPGNEHSGVISGISSRIESDSRTLKVRARIDNTDDSLRPGMSFEVNMSFQGQRFPAVDPLAVQWDSLGSYVWKVMDNKVTRVPVRIIQRNPESVLVEAELITGDDIVTEGVLSMRQGATVRVEDAARTATDNTGESEAGGKARQRKPDTGETKPAEPVSDAAESSTQKASEATSASEKQQGS